MKENVKNIYEGMKVFSKTSNFKVFENTIFDIINEIKNFQNKFQTILYSTNRRIDYFLYETFEKDETSDIYKACQEGKLRTVQYLIEKENVDQNTRVEYNDYELGIWNGETPIHIASKNGHLPIVKYLIEQQNVDIDIKGRSERTPLHYACEGGHLSIVQYLIEKQNVDIDIKGYEERTPLHCACEKCHLPIAEYLISKGADAKAKDENGDYVIHYASKNGLLPIVQYLIEQQNVDIDIKGYEERTPLHCACYFNYLDIVKYLVAKGANIKAKDKKGKTPYDLTDIDAIRYILK